VLNKIIPDLLFDLRSAGKAFEDMKQMGLSGATPLGEVNTKAPSWSAGGGLSARRSRPLARRPLISSKALFWTLPMR